MKVKPKAAPPVERFPYTVARIVLAEEIHDGDTVPMMLFPIGNWHSSTYPNLPLTLDLAEQVIANFEAKVQDRDVPVEASGRHDTSEPAVGWVKRVYLADCKSENFTGQALWCDWKPNTRGAMLLNEGAFRYNSVEIDEVTDMRSNAVTSNVLLSVCLTNVPVVRIMPPLDEASKALRLAEHCDGTCGLRFQTYEGGTDEPVEHSCGKRHFAEFALGELMNSYNEPDDNNADKQVEAPIAGKLLADLATPPKDGQPRGNADTAATDSGAVPTQGPAFSDLMAHASAVHAALIAKASGKRGVGSLRSQAKELCDKFSELCDDTPALSVEPDPASAGGVSQAAGAAAPKTSLQASEQPGIQSGSPDKKVVNRMSIALKLKLAENASDEEIEAKVAEILADSEATRVKLAESEKTKADEALKVRLSEALKLGQISAAEVELYGPTADAEHVAMRDGFLEGRKLAKVVHLSEQGGSEHRETGKLRTEMPEGDPSQQVSALSKIKMAENAGLKATEAQRLVLAENPDLREDLKAWRKDPKSFSRD